MRRKTTILLGCLFLCLHGLPSFASGSEALQTPQKVQISVKSATVKTFTDAMTSATGIPFSFSSSLSGISLGDVKINGENVTMSGILDSVLPAKGLKYEILDGTVVIYRNSSGSEKIRVTGKVTDKSGEPVVGAVVMKGDSLKDAALTDDSGNYTIVVDSPDTELIFSCLSYSEVRETVGRRSVINVVLEEESTLLDELVVVGYGTQNRRTLTTAIAKVSSDMIESAPVNTVGDALKGKVSGLRVATNNAVAGETPRFLIRGGSSINMSNDPIVIVDGITRDMSTINPNDIESIEVLKDAASASIYGARASNGVILVTTKKGSASAGPQISFETSLGYAGPSRKWNLMNSKEYLAFVRPAVAELSASALTNANSFGTGNVNDTDIWTTRYLNDGEAVPSGWGWMIDPIDDSKVLTFKDTDYQSQWFKDTFWSKSYIGVNGGNEKIKYAASASYMDDNGVIAQSGYELFTMHGNTSFKVLKNLEASTTFDVSRSRQDKTNDNYFTVVGRGIMMAPTTRNKTSDGLDVTGGTNVNQQTAEYYESMFDREAASTKLSSIFALKWTIIPGLVANAQYGFFDNNYRGSYYAKGERNGVGNFISGTRSTTETRTETARNSVNAYVNFNRTFAERHKVDATAGMDYMHQRYWYLTATSTGSTSDKVPILDSGINFTASNKDQSQALLSYFGRVTYNFDDRYILSGTFRADGSSKFAKGNRWGYFPAGSAAYIISNEDFWPLDWMNALKVRVSYGQTGNNGIGLYDTYGAYSTSEIYAGKKVTIPSAMQNSGLKWETTTQLDLGLDISFLNDRIRLVGDYYNKLTDNMLFSVTLPDTGTFSSVKANTGSVCFYGFELELHSENISKRDFSWTTDLTYSYNRNVVRSLPEEYKYTDIYGKTQYRIGGYTLSESGYRFGGIAVGEPLGRIYGYSIAGIIDTQAEADAAYYDAGQTHTYTRNGVTVPVGGKAIGDYEWRNREGSALTAEGEEQINSEDMFLLGNVMPHSIGGINNTVRWKNLTFNIYLDYAIGHSIYNYMKTRMMCNTLGSSLGGNSNLDKMVYDTWKHPGDNAKYARFFPNDADGGSRNYCRASEFNVEKGDYLCIRDVSISYNLPKRWLKAIRLKDVQVGVSGNNLHFFTAVSGSVSPETGMGSDSDASQYTAVNNGSNGDANFFPQTRKILFNLKITL